MIYLVLLSIVTFLAVIMLARVGITFAALQWGQDRGMPLTLWKQRSPEPPLQRFVSVACKYLAGWNSESVLVRFRPRLTRDIIAAGDPWGMNADEVVALSEISCVVTTIVGWVLLLALSGRWHVFLGISLGIFGGLTPAYLIGQKAVVRRIEINRQLPFALDLFILSMEAGSTFLESVQILVKSDPRSPLSAEFRQVLQAIQHGKTRHAALLDMAERIKSDDLGPIVSGINTGEQMGTPIGTVLRMQAEGIRRKRSERAEKLAGEASSKILFPTLLITVAILLMLMGPVIIKGFQEGWF